MREAEAPLTPTITGKGMREAKGREGMARERKGMEGEEMREAREGKRMRETRRGEGMVRDRKGMRERKEAVIG